MSKQTSSAIVRAFVDIDATVTFGDNGELPVKGGDAIGPVIGRLQTDGGYDFTVEVFDSHPEDNWSFACNHPGANAYVDVVVDGDGEKQRVYPVHGREELGQCEPILGIDRSKFSAVFRKGTGKKHVYSGMTPEVVQWLRDRHVTHLDFGGLVKSICAGLSALEAIDYGFKVRIITDAVVDLAPELLADEFKDVEQRLKDAGAEFISSADRLFEVALESDLPVIVDFWATWCPPCKMIGPFVAKLADELAGRAIVIKVDVDQAQVTAAKYGIQSIPQIYFFRGGEPDTASTILGGRSYSQLKAAFEAFAGTSVITDADAEAAYIAACEAAEKHVDEKLESAGNALQAAAKPLKKSFDRKVRYRKGKLAAGKLTQAQYDEQFAALVTAINEAIAPQRAAYSAIATPAWEEYKSEMTAAAAAYKAATGKSPEDWSKVTIVGQYAAGDTLKPGERIAALPEHLDGAFAWDLPGEEIVVANKGDLVVVRDSTR